MRGAQRTCTSNVPRTAFTRRTRRLGADFRGIGMKSEISHTPSSASTRVSNTFVSGRYICL